jgi:dTDP-4-dehydrorhamnose reductase
VFREDHDVYATIRAPFASEAWYNDVFANVHLFEGVDGRDEGRLQQVFSECRPQIALNCVGVVKQLKEGYDPLVAIPINALLPHRLARICSEHGVKLIQLSTDCVFSGERGFYKETEPPDALDLYGRSKLLGEIDYGEHLTIRTSMIGRQLRGNTGLMEWFFEQKGKEIQGYTQVIFSGLTTKALSEVILAILKKRWTLKGVYHVASQAVSKFDLLSRLNEKLHLGVKILPLGHPECDRSLDGSLFVKETEILIPSWDTMVDGFVEDIDHYERWRS